jgi:beta-fructofuranosidase
LAIVTHLRSAGRPRLHHTPPSGWVNDPLGLTWHDGRYHLFFQLVPDSTTWTVGCHWGHATSTDLVTWTSEPVALSPDGDEAGVWSGSLVVADDGGAVIFYTGVAAADPDLGWVRRAVPIDATWRAWEKQDVVVRVPDGEDVAAFRDPYVYRDVNGTGWRMLLAGATAGGLPALWMFTSPDLEEWTYAGRAAVGDGSRGSVWECPSLLRLDGGTVLVVADGDPGKGSHASYSWVEEEGDRLVTGPWRRLTYGAYYAASGFRDAEGRPGLVHWIRDVAGEGWAGGHSVPHLLAREGDLLVARPHPALAAHTRRVGSVDVVEDGPIVEVLSRAGVLAVVQPWPDSV